VSTKVRLLWQTSFDPVHLAHGNQVKIIRLYVPICFKSPTGWSHAFNAIIDLGSPLTVLPKKIWQNIDVLAILSEPVPLGGIGKGLLMARLARIQFVFLDTRKEVVELTIKAYLAEDDTVPLLLGIEDLITQTRLICDYPKSKAFLQIS